jgi:hypothetical protein
LGHRFAQGQYEDAARLYAQTHCSFEEVSLRFIHCEAPAAKDALREFLRTRLKFTEKKVLHSSNDQTQLDNRCVHPHSWNLVRSQDKTQRVMLCTWLTELYLDRINQLRDRMKQFAHMDCFNRSFCK